MPAGQPAGYASPILELLSDETMGYRCMEMWFWEERAMDGRDLVGYVRSMALDE